MPPLVVVGLERAPATPAPSRSRRRSSAAWPVGHGQSRTLARSSGRRCCCSGCARRANGRERRTSKPMPGADAASSGPLTQLTTEPSYLPGPRKPLRTASVSVTKMSWHCSIPKGCSSGSESAKLAAAPLLTCMRTSPSASTIGRSSSPLMPGATRRCRGRRAARSAPSAAGPSQHARQNATAAAGVREVRPAPPRRAGRGRAAAACCDQPGERVRAWPLTPRAIAAASASAAGRRGSRPGTVRRRCGRSRRSAGCRRRWRCRRGSLAAQEAQRRSSAAGVEHERLTCCGVVGRRSRGPARGRAAE